MKHKLLNIACWLIAITMVLFGASCEKDAQFREFIYPAQVPSGLSPASGYPLTNVTITGTNFDTLTGAVKVWFGNIEATTIVSAKGNEIVVQVPANAVSGKVSLQVWTTKVDSVGTYTVMVPPVYKNVSTNRGQPGDTVTITGEKFGTDVSILKINIGSTEAEVISFSDTQIQFQVPDAATGALTLNFKGYLISGPLFFIGDEKITGTLIGHSGSWGNNAATTIAAAVDGNLSTAVDAPTASGYVGYDVGEGKGAKLALVRYAPRASNPGRMLKGEIRGANDPSLSDFKVLHTITQQPPVGVYTDAVISAVNAYRYIYYHSPDGNCNIAEIEFIGKLQ